MRITWRAVTARCSRRRSARVTCLFAGVPDETFASQLGAMFMNEQFIPSALVDRLFGRCVTASVRPTLFAPRCCIDRRVRSARAASRRRFHARPFHRAAGPTRRHFQVRDPHDGLRFDAADIVEHELRWHRTIRGLQPLGTPVCSLRFGAAGAARIHPGAAPRSSRYVARDGHPRARRIAARRRTSTRRATRAALDDPRARLLRPRGLGTGLTGHNVRWRGAPLQMAAGDFLEERP